MSVPANFGGVINQTVTTNADTPAGNGTLSFGSALPAYVVVGMTLNGFGLARAGAQGGPPIVTSIAGDRLSLNMNLGGSSDFPSGSVVYFSGTGKCKARYNGINWIRVG